MAASVTVGKDEITIQLSGWNALPALRRIVRIPVAAVRSVRSDRFAAEEDGGPARTGVSGPLTGVRSGSYVRDGRRYLLAYQPGRPTVTLELDREHYPEIGYDAVILGVEPDSVELVTEPNPAA
jgi:hypothetical protein